MGEGVCVGGGGGGVLSQGQARHASTPAPLTCVYTVAAWGLSSMGTGQRECLAQQHNLM
jgi:hypothetical protein